MWYMIAIIINALAVIWNYCMIERYRERKDIYGMLQNGICALVSTILIGAFFVGLWME